MKRKAYDQLLAWKKTEDFKPLIVLGVRQCGKTYIIEEFCRNEFKHYKTINLLNEPKVVQLYASDDSSDQKYYALKALLDFDFDQEDSILFIDEIQESEALISELKYFNERHPNVRIICAGSLLGVKLARLHKPFPVGKVSRLYMYPMDFEEFLIAFGQERLLKVMEDHFLNNTSMGVLHNKAIAYYRRYLLSGGMPESVKALISCGDDYYHFDLSILDNIIEDYGVDMSHHVANNAETLKIRSVYHSLSFQLQNPSGKFQYSFFGSNGKARDYARPLDWLIESNMVQLCKCVKLPEKPLAGFADNDIFKIYYSDVGIFNRLINNNIKDIMLDEMKIYKGIVTENYIANQLKANGIDLYYWRSDRNAEVDFLISSKDDGIIPIEVKAEVHTKAQSLKVYNEKYHPAYMIRISLKDFGYDPKTKIRSVPLYAGTMIKHLVY